MLPRLIRSELIDSLVKALGPSLALRDAIRRRNGVLENSAGTLHHLLMDDACYVELLSELSVLEPVLRGFFEGNFVLNSYGGVINERESRSYVQSVHRDIRFGSDTRRFMMNALVMLDDFTLENGATHILAQSQNVREQPTDEHFYRHASRAIGERGSVLLFDSRMWHATGRNTTDAPRRALTLTFTSPFFKPQLDYARLFGYRNLDRCNAWMRQVLGFNARVPESLDEFYVPVEQRFYQRGQD
ncbi:phytanoyl-CoA dioxygenase family protein [Paraburkholderia sp. MMS20-SJTN17]|uniref:Phytanoyl-CoA dioxygenase family protein n=1 Tax=Paraburkholderia translucens TaxID=2886945 RepID=A0ABS8KCH2_9BURK|nr:phytanoyl-CoA dioxygenase family protein [Paraburkholderia sp. MMS20-SJTN17]MCC8402164.1 phytanoyl-CoA dioxygenase family protein [Paraburkholderia sp. MMS20-SJTN17]